MVGVGGMYEYFETCMNISFEGIDTPSRKPDLLVPNLVIGQTHLSYYAKDLVTDMVVLDTAAVILLHGTLLAVDPEPCSQLKERLDFGVIACEVRT
jgi:hypothetical protein